MALINFANNEDGEPLIFCILSLPSFVCLCKLHTILSQINWLIRSQRKVLNVFLTESMCMHEMWSNFSEWIEGFCFSFEIHCTAMFYTKKITKKFQLPWTCPNTSKSTWINILLSSATPISLKFRIFFMESLIKFIWYLVNLCTRIRSNQLKFTLRFSTFNRFDLNVREL